VKIEHEISNIKTAVSGFQKLLSHYTLEEKIFHIQQIITHLEIIKVELETSKEVNEH
jgi:hypothetical protein